jgi:hypothetical protein
LAKFQSPRAITQPKIIGPERNVNLICNSSLYTHIPNIKSISPSIAKKKWWQLNMWPNFKVQRPQLSQKSLDRNETKTVATTFFFAMLWDIDLILGMWVYNDKLQIKFTSRSGPMIFGWVVAFELWNLATYYDFFSTSKGHNSTKNHWTGTKCKLDL